MRSGDITMISLDADGTVGFDCRSTGNILILILWKRQTEVEGTVESGILAASWSPDGTILVLITGRQPLRKTEILLTSHIRRR